MSMTGVFGTLTNTTDKEVTITGGSSPVAGMVEVHETVKNDAGVMVMQPKAGGFVIPAKGTLELKPGGNHIMLMKMSAMPKIGTSVEPVSYTHLRAHETVLDLLCRLLLAKKNSTPRQYILSTE